MSNVSITVKCLKVAPSVSLHEIPDCGNEKVKWQEARKDMPFHQGQRGVG